MSRDSLANALLVLTCVLLCLTGVQRLMTPFERLVETRFPDYGAVATLVVLVGGLGGLLLTSVWLKARANHTRIGEYFGLARRP